jgi:hypothetical protein
VNIHITYSFTFLLLVGVDVLGSSFCIVFSTLSVISTTSGGFVSNSGTKLLGSHVTPVLGRETLDHMRTIGGLGQQSLFGLNVLCRMETVLSSSPLTGGYIDKIIKYSGICDDYKKC